MRAWMSLRRNCQVVGRSDSRLHADCAKPAERLICCCSMNPRIILMSKAFVGLNNFSCVDSMTSELVHLSSSRMIEHSSNASRHVWSNSVVRIRKGPSLLKEITRSFCEGAANFWKRKRKPKLHLPMKSAWTMCGSRVERKRAARKRRDALKTAQIDAENSMRFLRAILQQMLEERASISLQVEDERGAWLRLKESPKASKGAYSFEISISNLHQAIASD